MVYCEMEPYYTKSNRYFHDTVGVTEISYWQWMMQEYKCVLLDKQGSYSDKRDQHWGFNDEKARNWFMMRWS